MYPIHHEVTQGSADWLALRLGRITASAINNIADRSKPRAKDAQPEFKKVGTDYIIDLTTERVTGVQVVKAHFASMNALEWGKHNEDAAVQELSNALKTPLQKCGIYEAESGFLASPDAVFYDDNFDIIPCEVKCPYNQRRHIANVLHNNLIEDYAFQVQAQIMVLNAPYGYFASFDPRVEPHLQLAYQRVERCDTLQAILREVFELAESQIVANVEKLKNRGEK